MVAGDVKKDLYQITVARTDDVSPTWKAMHVTLFVMIGVFGFSACYSYGRAFAAFNFNCVLGAELTFRNVSDNKTDLRALAAANLSMIDHQLSVWGSPLACNFVQFMPLVQMFCAVIWGAYFVGMAKGGAGHTSDPFTHPWRIVAPLLVFCILMLIPVLVARRYAGSGYTQFCRQFDGLLQTDDCEVDVYTTQFQGGVQHHFHSYMSTAVISDKLTLFLWIGQLVVSLGRILSFADFQINRVQMTSLKQESLVLTSDPEDI